MERSLYSIQKPFIDTGGWCYIPVIPTLYSDFKFIGCSAFMLRCTIDNLYLNEKYPANTNLVYPSKFDALVLPFGILAKTLGWACEGKRIPSGLDVFAFSSTLLFAAVSDYITFKTT